MRQPVSGIAATVICVAASLAIVSLLDPASFGTWVTLIVEAMIPGQIVLSLVCQSNYPGLAGRLAQPLKGLALIGLAVLILFPMYALYGWAGHGGLMADAPAYQLDLWVASAVLARTFPMFVPHADFFDYWAFTGKTSAQGS